MTIPGSSWTQFFIPFRESTHEYVYIGWIYTCVFTDSSTSSPESTDGMRFVDIDKGLVLLANAYDFRQSADCTLHRIDAFNEDDNFMPRPVVSRLSIDDRLPNY